MNSAAMQRQRNVHAASVADENESSIQIRLFVLNVGWAIVALNKGILVIWVPRADAQLVVHVPTVIRASKHTRTNVNAFLKRQTTTRTRAKSRKRCTGRGAETDAAS